MARKPSFDFERRERQKAKDAKRAEKTRAKNEKKAGLASEEPVEGETAEGEATEPAPSAE